MKAHNAPPPSLSIGECTVPEMPAAIAHNGERSTVLIDDQPRFVPDDAANVLVKHLFAQPDAHIRGVSYAVAYKMAEAHVGGDIVDVYHFNNDAVAFSIADIAGKGTQAAIHAAMIKYGLRAYASLGLTPEKVLRALDRLYLENNSYERSESFATIFFGYVDPSRRLMTYASAAHEPAFVIHSDGTAIHLPTTAPLIGVFDDQHHLFKERFVELRNGSLFLAATDGVSEARDRDGRLFGTERIIDLARSHLKDSEQRIVTSIISEVERFCSIGHRDDIAAIAARFR
jgi:serine phosphatase RsbU (regulator of sigma subunit)